MVWLALLSVTLVFLALTLVRVGGAKRATLLARWPAVLVGALALLVMLRGSKIAAGTLALAAAFLWIQPYFFWPQRAPRAGPDPARKQAEDDARQVLGVGPKAKAAEIQAAFRAKMAQAHPDRGGTQEGAARLIAARDLLLKR